VLLLDEPLGALDLKLRKEMQVELKELQQQVGITFVYVTHDQEEALTMSDRIAVMHDGRVLQEGAPREIYEHPATRFVADFIGLTNFLDGEVVELRDNRVLVKIREGLNVWCESHGASAQGSEVTVAVRPEKIEMSEQAPTSTLNTWRGQMLSAVFLGGQTEYLVRLDQGPEVLVRRQNLRVNGSGRAASPGSFVYLAWAPEVSLVLPRSSAT
jgi:spermidine/putrescine transport system ATP-binding protein